MKKLKVSLQVFFIAILVALFTLSFAACGSADTSEVAGTYEMTSISGTIGGVSVNKSMYAYYRIIISEDGKATVQSKGAYGGEAYEAKGTCSYKNGVITLKSGSGFTASTEKMDYADGVITYKMEDKTNDIHCTLVLTRVQTDDPADETV